MRKRILLFSSLFLSFQLLAQKDTFQIKDFKFRTPRYHGLMLNFELGGHINNFTDNNNEKYNQKSLNLGPVSAGYFRTFSSDRKLLTNFISTGGYFSTSKAKISNNQNAQSSWFTNFSWQSTNRYYNSKNWFFEWGNNLSLTTGKNKNSSNDLENKLTAYTITDQVVLGFGKGRIEFVSDAQTALFILNDLKQQGLIQNEISSQTAYTFAQLITSINNTRVFDSRRRRIYELSKIDSFLKSSGLTETTDIRHFTTVNDNWALASYSPRYSGWNWFIRLKPGFDFYQNDIKQRNNLEDITQRGKNFNYQLSPEIGFEKQIPLSLKWQHGYGAGVSYIFSKENQKFKVWNNNNNVQSNDVTLQKNNLFFNSFYKLGYFPNNRTKITADAIINISRLHTKDGSVESTLVNYQPLLLFNAQYFISYRTFLNSYFQLGYNHFNNSLGQPATNKNLFSNFGVQLSHILF